LDCSFVVEPLFPHQWSNGSTSLSCQISTSVTAHVAHGIIDTRITQISRQQHRIQPNKKQLGELYKFLNNDGNTANIEHDNIHHPEGLIGSGIVR